MKKQNNILIFFISLFILAWNPLTWKWFYQSNPVYQSSLLTLVFWVLPILGILLILITRKKNWSPKAQNLIFTLSISAVFFFILVGINGILGKWLTFKQSANKTPGIIFTPYSKAHYKTTEFEYTAHINNVGLRNRDIDIQKGEKTYRILCFGDSWTFGWGLENQFSWPMQLEKYLHAKGYKHVEVINCGQGGQYTETYKQYLAKALPLLKPDLVLIGVLQLDDLAQLYEQHYPLTDSFKNGEISIWKKSFQRLYSIVKDFSQASFSNYLKMGNSKPKNKMQIQKNWAENSQKMMASFDQLQKLRFESFPDTVKQMFKTGNLNPGMVTYYLDFADRTIIFNNPKHPATQFALKRMTHDFNEMKSLCNQWNAQLAFVNLPINTFTGHRVIRNANDELNDYFKQNNQIDSMYKSVAGSNSIAYLQLTETFDSLADKSKYFFRYDGHPTAAGQSVIAQKTGDFILQKFTSLHPNQ